jgi:hypothetical protein
MLLERVSVGRRPTNEKALVVPPEVQCQRASERKMPLAGRALRHALAQGSNPLAGSSLRHALAHRPLYVAEALL